WKSCSTQLCSCTHSPGAMSLAAKPMIWPNLRIGWPEAIGLAAILWPRGTRSRALMPMGALPTGNSSTAISTLSCALRRRARGAVMSNSWSRREKLGFLARERLESAGDGGDMGGHGGARGVGVARLDGGENRAMFGKRQLHAARRGHQQPARSLQLLAHAVEDVLAAAEAEMLGEQRMKADVEDVEARPVALARGLLGFREIGGEVGARRLVEPIGRFGGDLAFERPAHEKMLAHVAGRDRRNE